MDKHWIDNLPGDYPRRMWNKYHKYRHKRVGLPFRDYVCRNPNVPFYAQEPCAQISALSPPLSSLYKINIGEYEDDSTGDTILEGLRKADTNIQSIVTILSAIDTVVRSAIDLELVDNTSNLIKIDKSDLPSDIRVGNWISKDANSYILSQAIDAFSGPLQGALNVIGVISDIDPNKSYAVITCCGIIKDIYTDLIPGQTYYISVFKGKKDHNTYEGYYSKPVLTGIASNIGVVDVKLGLFETTGSTPPWEDCRLSRQPVPSSQIKLEEITGEVITPSTPAIEWMDYLQIREITGEVIHKYRSLGYLDQFTLSEIVGEVITRTHTDIRQYMSSTSQMGIKDITGEVIIESSDLYMIATSQMGIKDITGEVLISANDYLSEYESNDWAGF
jgi:hypothetical protein